jgi:hypothetical protein
MQTRAVQPEFGRCLRAAQQQRGQQRRRLAGQPEHAIHVVLEARHAAATAFHHEAEPLQSVDGGQHLGFGRVHHRGAAGLLVAAQSQRIQRERIAVRHRVLLFDQHAEDAPFEQRQRADCGAGGGVGCGVHEWLFGMGCRVSWMKCRSMAALAQPVSAFWRSDG